MSKTHIKESVDEFLRIWNVQPSVTLPAKSSNPVRRRRSIVSRPSAEYLSASEVARVLGVSRDFVIRHFEGLPGVINLGHEETRNKRRYRVLRIPPSVLNRFLKENNRKPSVGPGNRVSK